MYRNEGRDIHYDRTMFWNIFASNDSDLVKERIDSKARNEANEAVESLGVVCLGHGGTSASLQRLLSKSTRGEYLTRDYLNEFRK